MANVNLRFNFEILDAGLEDDLLKLSKDATDRINNAYQAAFGRDTEISDHYVSNRGRLLRKLESTKRQPNSKYSETITKKYAKAFKRRYRDIVDDMPPNAPTWTAQKASRVNKGKDTGYRPSRKANYREDGLYSGYLRQSVKYGLGAGGGGMVNVSNLLLYGKFEVKLSEYPLAARSPDPYPYYFIEYLKNLGVIDSAEDFFRPREEDVLEIASFMRKIVEDDLIPAIRRELEGMDEEL